VNDADVVSYRTALANIKLLFIYANMMISFMR